MSDIAIRHDYSPVLHEDPTGGRLVAWAQAAAAANSLARALVKTTFVPQHFKGNEGDATAAIMAGDEVGLSPIASLRSFYVVHGTPALYARAMVALVQSKGHDVWTEKSTDAEVVVCGQRRGSDRVERAAWTMARAQKAGYTSNKKYSTNGQEMLWAKGASEICKKIASDVLAGIPNSVEDLELEDVSTTTVTPAVKTKTTVRRTPAAPAPEPPEPTFDEPEPDAPAAPEEQGETISDAQIKLLHILFKAKGFVDRDDSLSYVSQTIEREIISTKELSKGEASKAIDALNELSDIEPA